MTKCTKSYSGEHSGQPYSKTKWKCVHCGKTFKYKYPKSKKKK